MFYQRQYVRKIFRNYINGVATADEIVELKAAMLVFTDEEMISIIGENFADPDSEVSEEEVKAALPEARLVIQRAKEKEKLLQVKAALKS